MNHSKRFDELVNDALEQSFVGWDFSFVEGRLSEADTSWNYLELAKDQASRAKALVDMCTGGGEILDSFDNLPALTYATEGFLPNVSVAKKRLEPRGVEVVAVMTDEDLPLPSDTFDLIVNRHGAYSADELLRIAKPSGASFLTQQVGSENASGINTALHAPPAVHQGWHLETAVDALVALGFTIERSEQEYPAMSFKDIGALVFYLKAIPWQIPDFDVSSYRSELLAIHEQIEKNGSFDVRAHRFLLEARLAERPTLLILI